MRKYQGPERTTDRSIGPCRRVGVGPQHDGTRPDLTPPETPNGNRRRAPPRRGASLGRSLGCPSSPRVAAVPPATRPLPRTHTCVLVPALPSRGRDGMMQAYRSTLNSRSRAVIVPSPWWPKSNLLVSGPNVAEIKRSLDDALPNLADVRPNLADSMPILVDSEAMVVEFRRSRAILNRNWAKSGHHLQNSPIPGRC